MVAVQRDDKNEQVLVRTPDDEECGFSFLEVVDRVDALPQDYEDSPRFKENVLYLTTHTGIRVGFVLKMVAVALQEIAPELVCEIFDISYSNRCITFKNNQFETRNTQLMQLAKLVYESNRFQSIKGWRGEEYAIWDDKNPYVLVERAFAGLLGINTYGVHVNGYVYDDATKEIKFWIPRRSPTKPTWPLCLDNIVAGGIAHPYGVYATLLKESKEEANLDEDLLRTCAKAANVVSYLFYPNDFETDTFNSEKSLIVGEFEYVYDLLLPETTIPIPNDDEVAGFKIFTLQETVDALRQNQFKPNCGLVMTDFLIRHGYITPENEPNYIELVTRMHRKLPFPTRH